MNFAAIDPTASMTLPLAASRGSALVPLSDPSAFIQTLRNASTDSRETGREAATSFVASAFLMPILATLHESPFELKAPFAPGIGEKRFSPLLDQHLSDRIAKASNFPLVDVIVDRFLRNDPATKKEALNVRA